MSVSLRVAKKRRVEAPAAAFADPDDDVEPTLSTEEEDEQVQKLKDEGFEKAEGKEYSSAIRLWDMALKLRPQYAALHEMKAQVFLEVKQYWPAVQSATSATVQVFRLSLCHIHSDIHLNPIKISAEPSWAPGFVTLARAQYNFGEPEEALKSMDEALRLEPSNEDALAEIGEIRMQVQHRKQENHHTRVPTIEPD